jgi:hypothetical protein
LTYVIFTLVLTIFNFIVLFRHVLTVFNLIVLFRHVLTVFNFIVLFRHVLITALKERLKHLNRNDKLTFAVTGSQGSTKSPFVNAIFHICDHPESKKMIPTVTASLPNKCQATTLDVWCRSKILFY